MRLSGILLLLIFASASRGEDYIRRLQSEAVANGVSPVGHWGYDAKQYTLWGTHSNRLIPIYTYGTRGYGPGIDLLSYCGPNSVYRSEASLERLYGYLPASTVSPTAEYCDQTNLFELQVAAAARGKKHIFLVIFDGMDWQTTRAAAIYNSKRVTYSAGRGSGTSFQEYEANGSSQFGFMVTSPHNEGTLVDVDKQIVTEIGGVIRGGYDAARGGENPWTAAPDDRYLLCLPDDDPAKHAFTDSSSSAVSMTAGIKTFNGAVNVDPLGRPVETVAHRLQEKGWAVGVVTSVPISHATPAAAYAHNVSRDDYQDLTRDLLGLPSISHPTPMPGMDVVIGCGYGVTLIADDLQGKNFVPGNKYLTEDDRLSVNVASGGKYVVAARTPGQSGKESLAKAAAQAAMKNQRLFGFFGTGPNGKYSGGNLPFQTADGDYQPAPGRNLDYPAFAYSQADLKENPTLAEMTSAAIAVVEKNPRGFWLMVEAGDVDWANHDNNLDCSIGAVNSGDAAVKTITKWVEKNSDWKESLMIVTADHGHYLVLDKPEILAGPLRDGPPAPPEKVQP